MAVDRSIPKANPRLLTWSPQKGSSPSHACVHAGHSLGRSAGRLIKDGTRTSDSERRCGHFTNAMPSPPHPTPFTAGGLGSATLSALVSGSGELVKLLVWFPVAGP